MKPSNKKLRIFTDGACSGNPGPGGWAALFALDKNNVVISGRNVNTTNNRMELLAVIEAIYEALANYIDYSCFEVHSDSAYVVNAVTKKWITGWKRNGWVTSNKEPVKNCDLWKQLDELLTIDSEIDIVFVKVKGHDGVTLNEIVDKKAREESIKAKREAEEMSNGTYW